MVSKKSSVISPFIVMEVMEAAAALERQGENIIHLEVGEPDFDTPECIKEAAIRAIRDGKTHYTHSLGLVELREAIAEHYHRQYGVEVSPQQILVTSGTSPAMLLLFMSLLEPGDEVILPNPYYACYPNIVRTAEGKPVFVNVFEEEGFQYRPGEIRPLIGPLTKAIMVNSPANPTGNLMPPELMKAVVEFGKTVVSDEIYHGLVYEGKEHSILEFTRNALVINGFSKLYAMTGWRLGYLIVPPEYIRTLQKMHQNFFISANAFVQWAGISALKEAEADVVRMRTIYNTRRKFIIQKLRELGLGITVEPTGAFYILANARRYTANSFDLAFDILKKARVGCAPGIDFGTNAEGYLRFSYANSLENIEEAMKRLRAYFLEGGERKRDMKVTSADFVKSATKPSEYPEGNLPEVAMAGKSNVGKSSLINTLLKRKNLAKTSSSPGRTQTINFFRVNEKISFVDLPGYGYAKVPLSIRETWKPMVESYLQTRREIRLVVLILDARREVAPNDLALLDWLDYHGIPCIIVLTKADKLSQIERARKKKTLAEIPLLSGKPSYFFQR